MNTVVKALIITAIAYAIFGDKKEEAKPLLKLEGTVNVPSDSEMFSVAEHFLREDSASTVNIVEVSEEFKDLFGGIVEDPTKQSTEVRCYELLVMASNREIVSESGVTSFRAIWELLKKDAQEYFLSGGKEHVFYVRNDSLFHSVIVQPYEGKWFLSASQKAEDWGWFRGVHIYGNSATLQGL